MYIAALEGTDRATDETPERALHVFEPTHDPDATLSDGTDALDEPEPGAELALETHETIDDDGARLHVLDSPDFDERLVHQDALRVISRLDRAGHQAYLVGGCVRDLLLGRAPKDFDVATQAHPRQVKRLFRNGRIIGRRFKLVHVVYGDHVVETSTFRQKPPQEDDDDDLLIREDNVFGTAAEDALRRDFTINGLFFDPEHDRVLDYVGGLRDLEAGLLRTIGDPSVRLQEDPVRILRAIRFATRLGFRIEDGTWRAMCATAAELERSAPPRVIEEVMRLMRSGTALGAFRMMRACGALRALVPPLDRFLGARDDPDPRVHDRADSFWRLLEALDSDVHAKREPSTALCLAVLFLRVIEWRGEDERRVSEDHPSDLLELTDEVMEPLVRSTRIPRRAYARARRMIANQPRFTQPRKGRRSRSTLFLLSEEFEDSLRLFRLRSAAWGQGWDVYEAWVERWRSAQELAEEDVTSMRRKKRRRRRGGRRRSRRHPREDGDADEDGDVVGDGTDD